MAHWKQASTLVAAPREEVEEERQARCGGARAMLHEAITMVMATKQICKDTATVARATTVGEGASSKAEVRGPQEPYRDDHYCNGSARRFFPC